MIIKKKFPEYKLIKIFLSWLIIFFCIDFIYKIQNISLISLTIINNY